MDDNKTALTHRVTATAAAYLACGGFKPVESEVGVWDGWVADLASFVYPTKTEAKQLKLIPRCNYDEAESKYNELNYLYGSPLTAIVEVKISNSDLRKDRERKFSGIIYPAHLCYLAYPNGLIEKDNLPRGWIGLETTKDGKQIYRCHVYHKNSWGHIHPQRPGDMVDLIAAVAIRRQHRTQYAEMKAFLKAHNAEEREGKRQNNVQNIIRIIIEYLQGEETFGKSIRDILRFERIRIPKYLDDKIEWLETCKKLNGI